MAVTPQMRTQVTQLYVSLFGRAPEADGLGYWVQQLSNGKSLQTVAQDMYNVAPSRIYYPLSLSNQEIVERFYLNVLGREADTAGKAYWTGRLNTESTTGTAASRAIAVGTVVTEMITAVISYTGTNADALASQSLLNNKVAVGLHYAFDMNGNNVAEATALIPMVTAGPTGQNAANTQIDLYFNSTPVLTSGPTAMIAENAPVGTVLYTATATDADAGDTKTFSLKALTGDVAMLDINPTTGVVTLKASADFETKASYNFTVVVTDKLGVSSEKAVVATVTNVNEAPVAQAAAAGAAEGSAVINGTVTATDVDSTALTYSLNSAAPAGLTFNADGTYSFNPANSAFDALAAGATQVLTIGFTVTDGSLTNTKNLVITITGTNDAPVAQAVVAAGLEDVAVVVTPMSSDIDTGDTATYSVNSQPANGTVAMGTG
uniref:DUF4214 domain-containing protein n=1 Tax=Undibacterium sp. TaxID=1914977 RepID=UPI0037511169